MIVMKFGGSSLSSAANIHRVASIVQSQRENRPVVVVSALGDTTDRLAELLRAARRGDSYLLCKLHRGVSEYHFGILDGLFPADTPCELQQYMKQIFRDVHVRMLEVCEDGLEITPALTDEVLSVGEQLSSRIVAAAFQHLGINAVHLDSRKLILTDENFTSAEPCYWESFARIRWTVPQAAKTHVVVLGGFIGTTSTGCTTTLGRGGSDLSASIVAAAVNADELQVWKDVDGMMTFDPKLRPDGYCVRKLSYEEAAELAKAGACILHPESVAPARRLRIPVVIRNTFAPDREGTRIEPGVRTPESTVKSIACRRDLTTLEIRPLLAGLSLPQLAAAFRNLSAPAGARPELLAISETSMHVQISSGSDYHKIRFPLEQCLQVRVYTHRAVITLVGEGIAENEQIRTRLQRLFNYDSVSMLANPSTACSLRLVVPEKDLLACIDSLHAEFFRNVDPLVFATNSREVAANAKDLPKSPSGNRQAEAPAIYSRRWVLDDV